MGRRRKQSKRQRQKKPNNLNELLEIENGQFNPQDFSVIKTKNQAQANSEFLMPQTSQFPQLFTPAKQIELKKPESSIYNTPREPTISYPFHNQAQFESPQYKNKSGYIHESTKKHLMDSGIKNILQNPLMNSIEKLLHSEEKNHDNNSPEIKDNNRPIISIPKFTPNLIKNQNGYIQEAPTIPINRSSCNCKNSQCLKLYCDCFSNQRICQEHCNCNNCGNFKNSKKRQRAIEQVQKKTPNAFQPKFLTKKIITKNKNNQKAITYKMNLLHKQGCNCKNSQCQKRYCECFQLGLSCTLICNCVNCLNQKYEHKNGNNEQIENNYEVSTLIDLKQELKKKLLEIKSAKFQKQKKDFF